MTGSNFVAGSTVQVNGQNRPTQFISASALSAELSHADAASYGTLQLRVLNPPPGGGASNVMTVPVGAAVLELGSLVLVAPSLVETTQYRLYGSAGDIWVNFARGDDGDLHLALSDSALHEPVYAGLARGAVGAGIELWSSGRIVLPRTGTYLLTTRVTEAYTPTAHRFRVDGIDPAHARRRPTLDR